ncbi:MAG: hypothetical protein QOD30_659 [Actinomycetota bacterium]|nr:hypothetical protein [Actinomycetota bacterium]
MVGRSFDLNIDRVLEHWPVAHAVRELIANALDEHHLSGTKDPVIQKRGEGRWEIRDFGRGLRYEHLTQNENPEKLTDGRVIGQFGIGLKDALAVFDRHGIGVTLCSRHGTIRTTRQAKAGFPDVVTLHGVVGDPSDAGFDGTAAELDGVTDDDVELAKSFFRRYSSDRVLEETRYGVVLERAPDAPAARIYVKGLLVAEEPSFLFSYDILDVNASLRRALNRERSNVGRGAYSDRVKDILRESTSAAVAQPLTDDLARFTTGGQHDEIRWKDVAVHACRVLQSRSKVVFVTARELGSAAVAYARDDGLRAVVVPDDIVRALRTVTDLDGKPMFDLAAFNAEWNESFTFTFVPRSKMTKDERDIFDLTTDVLELADVDLDDAGVAAIKISETMRLDEGGSQVVGLCDHENGLIVIRRDQLADAATYFGTLLHEVEHAITGAHDCTFAFEDGLTTRLGVLAANALCQDEA